MGLSQSRFCVEVQDCAAEPSGTWMKCLLSMSSQAIIFFVQHHKAIVNSPVYFQTRRKDTWPYCYQRSLSWLGIEFIKMEGDLLTLHLVNKCQIRFRPEPPNTFEQSKLIDRLLSRSHLTTVSTPTLCQFIDPQQLQLMHRCATLLHQQWPLYLVNTAYIDFSLDNEANQRRTAQEAIIGKVVHDLKRNFVANLDCVKQILNNHRMPCKADCTYEAVISQFEALLNGKQLVIDYRGRYKIVRKFQIFLN